MWLVWLDEMVTLDATIMSTFKGIDVQSVEAKRLQTSLQAELVLRGYSTDDDPVMAEYIVVMLANQKTPDQINQELTDLIGSDYDASLTAWLWKEADKHINGAQDLATTPEDRPLLPPPAAERQLRRSRSPVARQERRRSRSPPPPYASESSREHETRQQPEEAISGRAFWQRRAEEKRRQPPPRASRELFSNAVSQATGASASDRWASDSNRSGQAFSHSQTHDSERPSINIFGRAGIPDPRAAEFVPELLRNPEVAPQSVPPALESFSQQSGSIFSRIDPMVPNNEPMPQAEASSSSTEFPAAPSETTLCRWNLKCTNPLCPYSHASPANAGPHGDENAMVLSQEVCKFGAACTNKNCTRSHVSPSIAFLDRKVASAVTNTLGGTKLVHTAEACKFQAACTNPSCAYAHFDANGNVVPCPALVALSNGMATQQQEQPSVHMRDDTNDTTITTEAPSTDSSAVDKSMLLDKALPNAPMSRPCKFGASCTRADCFFSHPPGRKVASAGSTQTPCRFGLGCTRPGCYFAHPPGYQPPTSRHTSDRLGVFGTSDDQDMERIIPESTTATPVVAE